jgi:hypothetical protein
MAPHSDKDLLQELRTVREDLAQLVEWWRARQAFFDRAQDPMWQTQLHTFHVARPFLDLIRRQAEIECTTITEIVNRAFQQFFGGRETVDDRHSSRRSRDRKAKNIPSPTDAGGVRR